ncbi:MAG: hypothetical protein VX520_00460, partial [Planctomycetota bacterium]|nr:hypothetical protein [Planctomycetota bacterium]
KFALKIGNRHELILSLALSISGVIPATTSISHLHRLPAKTQTFSHDGGIRTPAGISTRDG